MDLFNFYKYVFLYFSFTCEHTFLVDDLCKVGRGSEATMRLFNCLEVTFFIYIFSSASVQHNHNGDQHYQN